MPSTSQQIRAPTPWPANRAPAPLNPAAPKSPASPNCQGTGEEHSQHPARIGLIGVQAQRRLVTVSNLIKALVAVRQSLIDAVVSILIVTGGTLLIGGCAYRIFVRPDLTSPEAMGALWPYFLAGTVALLLGWFMDRTDG